MLETIDLTKTYRNLVAVRSLNMRVHQGDVFGFIGPNGAGKSTTIKIFATLLRPTHGDAKVGGMSVRQHHEDIRRMIGYMPDFFGVYEEMRVREYLDFFAAAYKIQGKKRTQVVNDVLELTDLAYKKDEYLRALSRGMTQRLGVARVLLHDPAVLLLDEPASGLDPRARIEMRALLRELQKMGKTILISSHILTELAEMCNAIGIIERGQLLYQGSVREIVERIQRGRTMEIRIRGTDADAHKAIAALERNPDVVTVEQTTPEETPDGSTLPADERQLRVKLIEGRTDPSSIVKTIIDGGFALTMLRDEEVDLEDVFLHVTKGLIA